MTFVNFGALALWHDRRIGLAVVQCRMAPIRANIVGLVQPAGRYSP